MRALALHFLIPLFFISSLLSEQVTLPAVSTSRIIGQSLWDDLSEKNEMYVESFIEGMLKCESENLTPLPPSATYKLWDELREIKLKIQAKKSQTIADDFFKNLNQKKEVVPLVNKKLYVLTLTEGSGKSIAGINDKITFEFIIKNIQGEVVKEGKITSEQEAVTLDELIPGMASGMIGMKEGERREIYIHSVFAYGDGEQFSPNTSLIAEVELFRVCFQEEAPALPELKPLTINQKLEPLDLLEGKHQRLEKEVAFQLGVKTWTHFKKEKSYAISLAEVILSIRESQRGNGIDISSQEMQDLIAEVHWDCYQSGDFVPLK